MIDAGAELLPHGLHDAVSEEIYHAKRSHIASKSALDMIRRSPSHYLAWFTSPLDEPTPALVFGKAFHHAVLEPEKFDRIYAVEPDFGDCRKKENKAERDAWRAESAGKLLLSSDDYATIQAMAAAVKAHPIASSMLTGGRPEVTARWRDEATGLECKARADYFVPGLKMIFDLKSTIDASPEGFTKAVSNYGYHRQDAFYRKGFLTLGYEVEHFLFIAVEKTAPYAVSVSTLDDESVAKGLASIEADMHRLAECIRSGRWPGYPEEIQVLKVHRWAA